MNRVPDAFARRMKDEFGSRLRIRWSERRREFHIEQQIGRGEVIAPPRKAGTYSDEWIAAKDGYARVMTIRVGDRMPCSNCNATLKVPVLKTGRVTCHRCNRGMVAAHFPLEGDALIQHLRSIDPLSNPEVERQTLQALRQHEAATERSAERELSTYSEAMWKDNFTRLFGIQSVGYTGKEFR